MRWFVYLNAPVSRVAAVIDLGPAVVGSPDGVWSPIASGSAGFSAAAGEEARNWTLERTVEEIDLRTPDGRSGVTPSMLPGWELGQQSAMLATVADARECLVVTGSRRRDAKRELGNLPNLFDLCSLSSS